MNSIEQDFRIAVRALAKSPGFTAVALATLALGIGVNTAIFSVVRAVLLAPLNFPHPEGLVKLEERGSDGLASNVGYPTYQDWRAGAKSFEEIAVASYWDPTLAPAKTHESEKLEGLRVSDGFFRMLGVRPMLGRDFTASEDRPKANRTVLLGYGLWKRRFGGDRDLPGRTIRMGDADYLVAGVLPPDFESAFSPFPSRPTQIWSPLGYDLSLPYACRDCRHLRAFGRLRDGVSLGAAQAELGALQAHIARAHPADYPSGGVFVRSFARQLTEKVRPALLTLLAAVGLVLLIGCANVASLLLARASMRQRETAIRCALGASPWRVARLFLAEALLLALAGGALGVAAASATLRALISFAPAELPRLEGTRLDPEVLAFAAAVSVLCGLLFGLAPALRAARLAPEPRLREGSRGSQGPRSQATLGTLVAFDAALAFVLLFGAGLLVQSAQRLLAVDPGFVSSGVLHLEVTISGPVRGRRYSPAGATAFYEDVLARLRSLPGVIAAGATSQLPLGGNGDGFGITIEGRAAPPPSEAPSADRYSVTPEYLAAMRIPIWKGRGIEPSDRRDSPPVVLINQTLARNEFPRGDALGHRVRLGDPTGPWRTIVGIVGDVRHAALDAPRTNQIYLPHAQFTDSDMVLVIRATGDPAALAPAARAVIRGVDPAQAVAHVTTMDRVVATSAAPRIFAAALSTAFALLAVLLSAVGVFGVVSGFVARRRREIGIRVALGAGKARVLRQVTGRTTALAGAGIAAAVPIALVLGRAMKSQLYDVSPSNGILLAAGALLALGVALAATLGPALRAARIDPMTALRSE